MILLLNMKQRWLVFRQRDEHAPVTKEYPKYMYNNTRKEKKNQSDACTKIVI